MAPYQAAAAALYLASMIAIGDPALSDHVTTAADLLAWHADTLPDPGELAHYASALLAARRRSRRRTSR